MTNQEQLYYDKSYSWILLNDNRATLGIVDSASKQIDEFLFAQLPKKGDTLKRGDTYLNLEALKWSGDIECPLSGKVIQVNDALFDEPSLINEDPYGKGWTIQLELSNTNEVNDLIKEKQK